MRLAVEVGEVMPAGAMPLGQRRFVAIGGGSFEGLGALAGRRGVVLPGGADWQLLRADDVLEVDARYLLQDSASGACVQVLSQGLRHGPPEVIAALARGEAVDPARYYFRTAIRFEAAADGPLAALNRVLALGIGAREARCVRLDVFALL
jgi:Protein of unknown function (DUF3237)